MIMLQKFWAMPNVKEKGENIIITHLFSSIIKTITNISVHDGVY